MSDQETIVEDSNKSAYHIFYREIRAESDELECDIFHGDAASNVETLLNDVFTSASGDHTLDELDITNYFERWIKGAIRQSRDLPEDGTVDDQTLDALRSIAEDFSESMKTRARAAGKYVVLILGHERLIACHSYTGKKALTTDMEIIEELLSSDNIDKYAEFRWEEDAIRVNHFDKYDTESFVEWLGVPIDEVVYDIKGDVKIYSEISGEVETTFRFTHEDIVEKLINSDRYALDESVLRTPDENYRIKSIRWGNQVYDTAQEFKQEALTHHYKLQYYKDKYEDLTEDMDLFSKDVIDQENKLVLISEGVKEPRVQKGDTDFSLVFTNNHIDLEAGWRGAIADKINSSDERIPVFHPGAPISDEPVTVGNLRVYNETGVGAAPLSRVEKITTHSRDFGTSNMGDLMNYLAFRILREESDAPVSFFFEELEDEFLERHETAISDGCHVTINEGGEASVELKSAEWFYEDKDRTIVEKLSKELNNGVRVLIGGVDEDGGRVKGIQKNRFNDDRLGGLEQKTRQRVDADNVRVIDVPIDTGERVITAIRY